MTEKVTIYLHSGDRLVADIDENDFEMEQERLEELGIDGRILEDADQLVESALTVPPKPRWCWIGDAFVFTQAVAGVSVAGDTTKENS